MFQRLFAILYERVKWWKDPGSMNLDQDTAQPSVCPVIVFAFCLSTFWMRSLLNRSRLKGCLDGTFPPLLTPNLSVLTLCWVMGSVSLNLPSLMSGFKKGFPIFLVISWTSFLFYSRQKAFRFSRKYFKSIKSIFNRSGLQVLWMKGLSSFGSNIWDKERNKRQCTRDKERNQSVNISWV